MGASIQPDAPIQIFDTDTGERWPYWSEIDALAPDPTNATLIIRPAMNFTEGHHIVIGIQNLVDTQGVLLTPQDSFVALRDGKQTNDPAIENRREDITEVITTLQDFGIEPSTLQLAWDFTIASEENLSQRLLGARNDAFSQLGNNAPAFTVEKIEDIPEGPIAREVTGTYEVPSYLTGDGKIGSHFNNDGTPLDIPETTGTYTAKFHCTLPRLENADATVQPIIYGHGLFGYMDEIDYRSANLMSFSDVGLCATNWVIVTGKQIGRAHV